MFLLKRIISMLVYFGEAFFLVYIGTLFLKPSVIFDTEGLLVVAAIFCIPTCIATYLLISTIQEYDKKVKVVKIFVSAVFLFYILVLFSILFMGIRRFGDTTESITDYIKFNSNFIPFRTIITYIRKYFDGSINKSIVLQNLIGNLLLFAPMGLLLPSLFKSLRKANKFIIIMAIILICVEVEQMLTRTGGIDVDDVILNLTGAVIFFALWRLDASQELLKKLYIVAK